MKRLFTIMCLLMGAFASGQCYNSIWHDITINFEDTCYRQFITIDTTTYGHNIWQVGTPHKTVFFTSGVPSNVIVTDTLLPYPPHNTSVFYFKISSVILSAIQFGYKLDIDPGAIAQVDIAVDTGHYWYNVMDTLPPGFFWSTFGKPDLSTSSAGMGRLFRLEHGVGTPGYSFVVRFTFTTGSTPSTRDGWMIDGIQAISFPVSVLQLLNNPNLITIYPNPSHGNLFIYSDKPNKDATITIYNTLGQQVYAGPAPNNHHLSLSLPDGLYTLRYSTDEEYCVKQIVIQK
jgi:hypothetical protein